MPLNTSGSLCRITKLILKKENWNSLKSIKRFMTNASADRIPSKDAYASDSDESTSEAPNRFRIMFKTYKKRVPLPDFSSVIDIREVFNLSKFGMKSSMLFENREIDENFRICAEKLGLCPPSEWRVCEFDDRPGLYLLPGLLQKEYTAKWLDRMFRYAEPPNTTNLTAHGSHPDTNLIEKAAKTLRWTTLGVEYDWDTKEYPKSGRDLPEELKDLGRIICESLNLEMHPDAAIVNYYPPKSTLSPHVDRSERTNAPLVSMSLGQTAVYLTGGKTLSESPIPLWLRNGDVLVMYGEQRLVYHAIPCVGVRSQMENFDEVAATEKPIREYLNTSRVNITIRQVNPKN